MSDSAATPADSAAMLALLLRTRWRMVVNHTRETLRTAHLRVIATIVFLCVIWAGLYGMFWLLFAWFERNRLEGAVAIPMIFNFFFLMMLVLLVFSNAIIAYGSLFSPREPAYLLASPIRPGAVVALKYAETLLFSSWSLILLGLPLMAAMARTTHEPGFFYPLFIAYFLAFIPIPGAIGLIVAWAAARFLTRDVKRVLIWGAALLLAAVGIWGLQSVQGAPADTEAWLRGFLSRMRFIESAVWPNAWVARGIDRAIEGHLGEAGLYLWLTLSNGAFLSWLAVRLVSRHLGAAYDAASGSRGSEVRRPSAAAGGVAGLVFFYLPRPLRLIAAKDLRTFARDPIQWSQLLIFFTLMALYLLNIPNIHGDLSTTHFRLLMPFMNLCAVSLILSTFTARFVFPLPSLEGQQLWLISLLPIARGRVLAAKFAFAMTVTVSVGCGAMLIASGVLRLDWVWTLIHLALTFSVCFATCGMAVGIGARLPSFDETNPARIANGLGGTINLIASVVMVAVILFGAGYASYTSTQLSSDQSSEWYMAGATALLVAAGVAGGSLAMRIGARHFERVQV